jgi:hypothetical protein
MSIFTNIRDAINARREKQAQKSGRAAPQATPQPQPQVARAPQPAGAGAARPGVQPQRPAPQPQVGAQAAAVQTVDVEEVLEDLAQEKGGGGNWRTSIVDLLKLLDLDSSLSARKELAQELKVNAGDHGSAEQNTALIKAVWKQLAANGGKVPASLRD